MGQFRIPVILFFVFLILSALLLYKFWPVSVSSTANVILKNSRIVVEFNLLEKDQQRAQALSEKLGVSNDWTKGGIIKLDEKTTEALTPFFPLVLQLEFKDQEIDFNSNKMETLVNQYFRKWKNGNLEQISPLGGNFKMTEEKGVYLIEIDNPQEVLDQATMSGALKVSPELSHSSLWQTAGKLAKIKLQVSDSGASGKIILK